MANIIETVNYDSGVYLIATSDSVVGGPGGIANLAAANLANRTAYLKSQTDTINATLPTLAPKLSPALTGTPTTSAPNVGDSSAQISTTAFVQITSKGRYALNVAGNSSVTLSATQAGYAFIEFVGALTGNIVVTVPGSASLWTMKNSTSGAYTITISSATAGGAKFVLPQGGSQEVITDGQNVYSLGYLPLTGGTMSGPLQVNGAITSTTLNITSGGSFTGNLVGTSSGFDVFTATQANAHACYVGNLTNSAGWFDYFEYLGNTVGNIAMNGTTGINVMSGGALGLGAGSSVRATITSGGRLLIGTTADDGANLLQVSGNVALVGAGPTINFNNGGPAIWSPAAKTLAFTNGNGEVARFSPGGRILIGTTTDDGANPVQIYSGGGDGTGFLAIAGGNSSGKGGAVSFAANIGSAPMSQIKGVLDNLYSGGGYDQGGLAFLTRPVGSGAAGTLTERMRITNGGRILIGTSSDDGSSLLQVAGNTYFYGVSYFGQTSAKAWINADANAYYLYGQGNALVGSAGAAGYLGLVSANAERLRVTPSGRILIGTTADNGGDLLQVAGTVRGTNGVGALIAGNGGGSGQTSIILSRDGGPTDQKRWEMMQGGDGTFALRAVNDAYSAAQNALWVTRGTGSTVGNMVLLQNGGRVLVGTLADDGASVLQVNGQVNIGGQLLLPSTNGSIELGSLTASNTPYIDFHSSGSSNDYDVRIIASGGTSGTPGVGSLTHIAANNYWKLSGTGGTAMTLNSAGRVLIGTSTDDGANMLQVAGTGMFANNVSAYSSANDTQFTLSASNYTGGISLEAYNKANTTKKNIALAPWGGRVQIGSVPDDGSSLLQVGGNGRFSGEVQTTGYGIRVVAGNYGAFMRNDGTTVFLFQTASGDQYGAGNSFRPFQWTLSSGAVTIDQTGAGTTFGGSATFMGPNVTINRNNGEGRVMAGQNDGYFYANTAEAGWYSPTQGNFAYNFAMQNIHIGSNWAWHSGNASLTGSVQFFAMNSAPAGFMKANGAAVSRATYAALFAAIGTTYGAGDGSTTFNLPDMRGYFPRGWADNGAIDSGRAIGSVQGDVFGSHNHGVNDPGHGHGVNDPGHNHGVNDPGHSHWAPVNNSAQGFGGANGPSVGTLSGTGITNTSTPPTASSGTGIWLSGSGTGIWLSASSTGISTQGSGGNETRPKNIALLACIKY